MLREHSINKKKNFISGWYLDNNKLCNDLIDYFEKYPLKKAGIQSDGTVNKKHKDSTDLHVSDPQNPLIIKYLLSLSNVIEEYKKLYKYCNEGQGVWSLKKNHNSFVIQRYKPNQGYHKWHTERTNMKESSRHLAFMTYLNDVNDGGETQFYHQNLKIKPEKGLTLIWGTDWTFVHKGIVSPTETKYITTGHYHYD